MPNKLPPAGNSGGFFASISAAPAWADAVIDLDKEVQSDAHLPAIDVASLSPEALRQRFLRPPTWQPEVLASATDAAAKPIPAAVLLAIVTHPAPSILLTLRAANLSTHAGQIAFAGGKIDAQDASVVAAAKREANEELGLMPSQLEVLGQLPACSAGAGVFLVTPVVALLQPGFKLQVNVAEVAEVFEVPLAFLMNPANHQRHQTLTQGVLRHWLAMPYQDGLRQRFIWGATALMLRNFYRFLSA